MANVNYKSNPYADALGPVFEKCPKAVLAAIAVSFATDGGQHLEQAQGRILREWEALFIAQVVPQPVLGEFYPLVD